MSEQNTYTFVQVGELNGAPVYQLTGNPGITPTTTPRRHTKIRGARNGLWTAARRAAQAALMRKRWRQGAYKNVGRLH